MVKMLNNFRISKSIHSVNSSVRFEIRRWHMKKAVEPYYEINRVPDPTAHKYDAPALPVPTTIPATPPEPTDELKVDGNFRVNDLNIQLLSRSLYEQIFGNVKQKPKKDARQIKQALHELKQHSLPGTLQKVPDVDLQLPKFYNSNIEDHFLELGRQQSEPYKQLVESLLFSIPKMPEKWNFSTGWTKYDGDNAVPVDHPEEDALIFDVEVCCQESENPVMATAVSNKHWYSWVSKDLHSEPKAIKKKKIYISSPDELVPLESSPTMKGVKLGDRFFKPKIVIGHNVSFDRARIKEQYWIDKTGLRFVDTMSMHIAVSGVTSYQKAMLRSGNGKHEDWREFTSLNNSLSEVHKFYCGQTLEKEIRDVFVTGELKDVRDDFQNLMTYCAKDVQATHNVLIQLWPIFTERFPHPVTFAGMLELSTCYLPVNRNWKRYVENSQQIYDDTNAEAKLLLSQQVDKSCQLLHNEKYKSNVWLWDEDWKPKPFKLKKEKTLTKKQLKELEESALHKPSEGPMSTDEEAELFDKGKLIKLEKKFSELLKTRERLPIKIPHLAGYPEWYRKLCEPPRTTDWKPGPLVSTSMKVVPKLLSLTWNFMPIHHLRAHGWCYITPYKTLIDFPEEEFELFPLQNFIEHFLKMKDKHSPQSEEVNMNELAEQLQNCLFCNDGFKSITCGLIKLPHKDGADLNVGNPLARDFIDKFSDLEIAGSNQNTIKMIQISRQLSYWKNNRQRIEDQFVVWLKNKDLPSSLKSYEYGVILPRVIVSGTLTRRAVEPTWMTAANAMDERIGSELRSMIQAPPGYSIVGADVDSQELWIASLFGDAYCAKEHGCTPFSWMTLSGQKADGTDMHSVTAKTMGISRNNAKVINYARIYGAGQKFADRLLRQFVPGISDTEATSIARKMIQTTKGKRIYELKPEALTNYSQRTYTSYGARQLCTMFGKSVNELFERPKWKSGSESAMFNSLEEIACSHAPRTPFLNSRLTKALEPTDEKDTKYMPTRINWAVQSSAVDFLHLMLVCMRWLIDPRIRFCLSFHDEVRYLVPEKQKYQTALALHVTNLLVRSFCVQRMGMCDLPQSVAFFSAVEVDTVLRKESTMDCVTPSNPHGLSKGYGIEAGESLNISQAVEKAKGQIGAVKVMSK